MKKLVLLVFVLVMLCVGCMKSEKACTSVNPTIEIPQILAYAAANSLTVTKHSSGIYYQIVDAGTGASPTINSHVTATYTGKFLDNTIFDQATTPVPFALTDVIEGWQIGLPLIKAGGKIKLIIPSSYAYGCNGRKNNYGNVVIPPNTVLYFEVQVIDVQ